MRRAIALLIAAGMLAALSVVPASAATPAPAIENTGLARRQFVSGGGQGGPPPVFAGAMAPFGAGFVAVEVSEASQGATDLNGDGDTLDSVLHVFAAGGATTNTKLSLVGRLVPFGDGLAFAAGTGLYLLDGATGAASKIHPTGFDPVPVGTAAGLRVGETATDLNGDGDTLDNVAHFYDPATAAVTNSKIDANFGSISPTAVDISGMAAITSTGFSIIIYDPATGTTTDTVLDGTIGAAFGTNVAVGVSELAAGTDLNGDGDTDDPSVIFVYDTAAKTTRTLALATLPFGMTGVGTKLAFTVPEAHQGFADLNGDGDPDDTILHVFDAATGVTTNAKIYGETFKPVGNKILFTVLEPLQGFADRNGDGDIADAVATLYDLSTGTVTNTALAEHGQSGVAGGRVGILVHEASQGNSDLNGDTDAADAVLHIIDPATGSSVNTGLAADPTITPYEAGDQFALFVWEADQGADLNGDGDRLDAVLHIVNPATGTSANTRLAGAIPPPGQDAVVDGSPWVAFAVSETDQAGTDLNGDGDTLDDVVHFTNTARRRSVGLVDPSQGQWHLRAGDGTVNTFFYGDPGDVPFMGDWDCDGVETPGLYRQSDGFVYLRNSNTVGVADIKYFFGNPDDVPLAGDFDGDGCDTVSLYRPDEQKFYIINKLGSSSGGLGAADFSYTFGDPGDKPFVGDFDGDGTETAGLHRESTGLVYFRNTHTAGIADVSFIFGDPGDRFVAGDWGYQDGMMTPALFRPSDSTFFFRWTNTAGVADDQLAFGQSDWLPVAGS